MAHIEAQCDSCSGSGVYQGFVEASRGKDVAVICVTCGGTGAMKIKYTPFTGRKERRGIRKVYNSTGTFIAGRVGPESEEFVTYAEFVAGKRPPRGKAG